ncbi:hypothetical protein DYB32_006443 [Aphanomyces invadans]|uniref:Uncharacterized protein n=1 Tax=Aphanomyces invadans TaxID=157072 RepID=A0A3R6Y6E7_9STRA|nr:hypothetical protein DYB32_006443 [Aphanomyces invadans]
MFDSMLPIGISLIQELRRMGNRDLVQVYHCLAELSPLSLRLLHRADAYVEVVDVCADFVAQDKFTWTEARRFRNFFIKPLALVHTRLEEVILLDADDILFVDPATLWDVDAYKATGTMFFYDREIVEDTFMRLKYTHVDPTTNNVVDENTLQQMFRLFEFDRFGLHRPIGPSPRTASSLVYTNQSAHEQDSSIVVVDKRRHPRAMDVLWFLITNWRFRFPKYSWGDKENFWLAYELSQSPYSFSPHAATAAGVVQPHDPLTVCGEIAHYFPTSPNTTLLHINGNALINPYTKTNAINGYDKAFRPSKLDLLVRSVPTHRWEKFFLVLLVRKGSVGIYTHEDDMAPMEVYKLAGYSIRVKSEKRRPHQFKVRRHASPAG